jgi:hypothetical protein
MKLYLDMDGVIADFFKGLQEHYNVKHWKEIEDPRGAVDKLQYTNYFNTLELFPTSQTLVDAVRDIAGKNYGICSSPLRNDMQNSSYWKRVWLERHNFMPTIPNLIFTGNKHRYAVDNLTGHYNILVDDKPSNINDWENAGGLGFLYQANQDSVQDLIANLQESFNDDSRY